MTKADKDKLHKALIDFVLEANQIKNGEMAFKLCYEKAPKLIKEFNLTALSQDDKP